jgi:hypothetical protein
VNSPAVSVEILATVTDLEVIPVSSVKAEAGIGSFDEADLVEDEVPGVGDAVDEHAVNVTASIITLNPTASLEPCRRGAEQRWTGFIEVLPLLPVASEP